jgi:multiple sugar transport system substrate-binding protein
MQRDFTSRRDFLRLSILGVVGTSLVAACAPAAAPTAAPAAPAAPAPTTAPAQAPAAPAPTAAPAKPAEAPKAAAGQPTISAPVPTTTKALSKEKINLVFQGHVAGGEDEQRAYDITIDTWNKEHPNVQVEYAVVADPERIQKVTAQVAAGTAPDMWRHNHGVVRLWASQGHLLDLSGRLPGYDKVFLPALAEVCTFKGKLYAFPHTTDTSALFYRNDALDAIGVKAPAANEAAKSWTFEQFGEICDKLLAAKKQEYAFTHNQGGGRWIGSFLYATGGKVVTDDFLKIAINNAEGIQALKFLKSWTDKKWSPVSVWTNASMRNADTDPFCQGTTSMGILGQWNITYLQDQIKNNFTWNVTFEPRAKIQSTSLGGTPIVIWSKTKYPDDCAAFFEFFESIPMLRLFDEMANYLPVRSDLAEQKINYKTRPDLMAVFQEQVKSLPLDFVRFTGRSYSSGISTIMLEETTKMMSAGQSAEDTAKNIETRGNKYITDNPDVENK